MNEKLIKLLRAEQKASNKRFEYMCEALESGMSFEAILDTEQYQELSEYVEYCHDRICKAVSSSVFDIVDEVGVNEALKLMKEKNPDRFKEAAKHAFSQMSEKQKENLLSMFDTDTFDFLFEQEEGVAN